MAFRSVRAGFAIVLLAAALGWVWPEPASAGLVAAFQPVYSVNDSGSVVLRGNANLTCDGGNPACAAARNATVTGGALNNNGYRMRNVDVDAEPSFNFSTADLAVPAGATVLYAGLFWGGDTAPGTGTPAPDESGRNTVRFKVPGGAYRTITANRLTDVTTFPGHRPYQGYADVSALVAGGGAGTYAVADIQAATGVNDRYAAWSPVVVLHDPAQPVRNMVVYDGFGSVRGITPADATVTIPVAGFLTPPSGPVTTSLGAVAYEGDGGSGGDSLRLDGTPLTDALSPATNFFNSTISDHGASVTTRDPADANLLGFDIDHVDTSGVLANDTDPNPGDTLTVAAWDAVTAHGGTVTNSGGVLRYTPAAGYRGADAFTYTLSDGNGGAATAAVTLHVSADLPVAAAATTPAGTPLDVAVLANDSDPGGGTLTVTGVGAPGHGTAARNGAGTVEVMVGSVDLPITGPAVAPHALAGLLMLLTGALLRLSFVSGAAAGHRPGSRASAPTTRRRSRRP